MVLASLMNIRDGSNAVRLVKGVWKKRGLWFDSQLWQFFFSTLPLQASALELSLIIILYLFRLEASIGIVESTDLELLGEGHHIWW